MKITIIDTYSYKSFHEVFNTSLLMMLSKLGKEIVYKANESNINTINGILSDNDYSINNVRYEKLKDCLFLLRYKSIGASIYFFVAAIRLILQIHKVKDGKIVLNYNNVFALPLIFILFRRKDIVIFCHGEMQLLEHQSNVGYLGKFQYLILKSLFRTKYYSNSFKFIVLGDKILDNIKPLILEKYHNSFYSCDHPYFEVTSLLDTTRSVECEYDIFDSNCIKIGIVGSTNRSRGATNLCYVLDNCMQNDDIKFYHIGKCTVDFSEYSNLRILSSEDFMPRSIYIQLIKKMDYILFLYPNENYKFIASGALLEAVSLRKPIIGLNNDFFDYISSKYGNLGYLSNSIDDVISDIKRLKDCKLDYVNITSSLERIKTSIHPDILLFQLKSIF